MQNKFTHGYDTQEEMSRDFVSSARIETLPALLELLCDVTGMGFAAVALVSGSSWTVCAVKDKIDFGPKVGDQLPVESMLRIESSPRGESIIIDHASRDSHCWNQHTPRIESHICVPIVLSNGHYFGNLFGLDPVPAKVSTPAMADIFKRFASLISYQLATDNLIKQANDELVNERAINDRRIGFLSELGKIMRSPLRAIGNATDRIDCRASEPLSVKALATRIRTNALRISSLVENFENFARCNSGTQTRPIDEPRWSTTGADPETLFKLAGRPIERSALESLLMQRVGELNAHLGRYDMYALTIASWLDSRKRVPRPSATFTIRTRGEAILSRLRFFAVPENTMVEFDNINQQLLSVLGRQEIAATREASIPALRDGAINRTTRVRSHSAWYDYLGASDRVLQQSVASMEGDIAAVVSLYLRLAGWAGGLTMLPCWR